MGLLMRKNQFPLVPFQFALPSFCIIQCVGKQVLASDGTLIMKVWTKSTVEV